MNAASDADLDLILDAARIAGERAQAMRRAGLSTLSKADGTPVSDADTAVDLLLKTRLGAARPDYGWLSEETADDPARLACSRLFVVDPIDGTHAFVRDKPWWAVSISVVENGRPVAGVVHAPDRAETYHAVAGGGAWLNDQPIRHSGVESLENCAMLGSRGLFAHAGWAEPWPPMRVESPNSIAYRLCLVAAGAFDAALALSSKCEWDLAAADLIGAEAGCLVTDHKGRRFVYNRPVPQAPSLVCAGPALHQLILQRVAPIDLPS